MIRLIVLWILLLSNASFAETPMFYKQPNVTHFIDVIKTKNKDLYLCEKCNNIFILMGLNNHQNLVKEIIYTLPIYDVKIQSQLIQGLVNLKGKKILKKLPHNVIINSNIEQNLTVKEVQNIQLKLNINNEGDLKHVSINGDSLWSAFIATGDPLYLRKFLAFLSKTPLKIRILSAELINRERIAQLHTALLNKEVLPDIKDIIQSLSNNEKYEMISYQTIERPLSNARKFEKDIEMKLNSLIKENPELDYLKDVKL